MQWIWKNKVHFVIWGVFIVYLLIAPQLYTTFLLKNGKPFAGPVKLPAPNGKIVMNIEEVRPVFYDGEEVYLMTGWVFSPDIAESAKYEKKVVLHSVTHDVLFNAEIISRKDLNKGMPQYPMDLENAGFRAIISKDVLRLENYRIGFVLENGEGQVQVYQMTDKYIERKPNGLRYIDGS